MSLSLAHIINTLCPDYKLIEEKSHIKQPIIEFDKTTIEEENELFQVLHCILFHYSPNYDVQESFNVIQESFNTRSFVQGLNMNKIITSFTEKQVNNDVLLFLSGMYEFNIYVFNEESRILRMYYLEEKCNINNFCVILTLNNGIYQTSHNSFEHSDVDKYFPNVLKIAIGLNNNKRYEECSECEKVVFCQEKTEDEIFITELSIFNSDGHYDSNFLNSNIASNTLNAYYNSLVDYVKKTKKIRIIKSK